MLDFHRSSFTWHSHPWRPDPFYRYPGGFVGQAGQAYHVRFRLDAACTIEDEQSGRRTELFLSAPCRTEYTIADRNLFQVPSSEFRFAFSRDWRLSIANRPSTESEPTNVARLSDAFQAHKLDLRTLADAVTLTNAGQIIDATLADAVLNGHSTYRDPARQLAVTVEYPINLINLNVPAAEFQVCTGPVLLPDLRTWDGEEVQRVFVAHVAFTAFDHVEFILRREVTADPSERSWLEQPVGRDRFALHDPAKQPPNYPPPRPKPTTYQEVWELPAHNVVTSVG
ncbi:MAG: hypothetical protein R3C14_14265 [Caldilineaceae bacterium]